VIVIDEYTQGLPYMTFINRLVEAKNLTIEKNVSYPTGFKCIFLVGGPMNMSVSPEPLVETEFGMRPISAVKPGDKIWAVDENGINKLTKVEKVLTKTDPPEKMKLVLENGETFLSYPDDRILLTNGRWVRADSLREDDDIVLNQES